MTFSLQTPVVLIIFRRPETTRRVIEAIAEAKPPRLYVFADGPRTPEEAPLCAEARAVVDQGITWDCDVIADYADVNLQSRRRVTGGLDRVFQREETAIILEDDCVPHLTFFRFCQDLLEQYRDEPRVMHISGDNFQTHIRVAESYYFSRYPQAWGWATWRRAWQRYDVDMKAWTAAPDKTPFLEIFTHPRERNFWRQMWDTVCTGQIDAWDYQWTFACITSGGLCVVPAVNLVTNIGFGADASHTFGDRGLSRPAEAMAFPLRHPAALVRNARADRCMAELSFMTPSLSYRIVRAVRHRLIHPLRRAIGGRKNG